MGILKQCDTESKNEINWEKAACEILLLHIDEQNNDCKKKLSDLVAAIFSANLLEQAENFQTRFLNVDNKITLLKNEMAQLDKWLCCNVQGTETKNALLKLSQDLFVKAKNAEQSFIDLKAKFFDYLMSITGILGQSKRRI